MAHNTEAGFETSSAAILASAALAPLRAVDRCFRSIVAANRLSKELENALHTNEEKLSEMGLARDEIVQHVAQNSKFFPAR